MASQSERPETAGGRDLSGLQEDDERYTERVVSLLWPSAPDHGESAGLLALPSARKARLLVPATQRRVAASAVRRYSVHGGAKARLASAVVAATLRSGLLQLLIRRRSWVPGGTAQPGTITAHLRSVVSPTCEVAVYVGLPRGNRKPVLLVIEPDGALSAVAKLGVSPLSGKLIVNESAALRQLAAAPLEHVVVPRVLFSGDWAGCPLLVQSALPELGPVPADADARRVRAAVEISRIGGVELHRIETSPVLDVLGGRIAQLPQGEERHIAERALARLRDAAGDVEFPVGSWHGDWTRWNQAPAPAQGLLVWDWERFCSGVPLGYDALHYSGQVGAGLPGGALAGLGVTREALPSLLAPFGVSTRAQEPVFVLYLVELLVRYTEDAQTRMTYGRLWVDALTATLETLLAALDERSPQTREAS